MSTKISHIGKLIIRIFGDDTSQIISRIQSDDYDCVAIDDNASESDQTDYDKSIIEINFVRLGQIGLTVDGVQSIITSLINKFNTTTIELGLPKEIIKQLKYPKSVLVRSTLTKQ
jgi:hypothetical protein